MIFLAVAVILGVIGWILIHKNPGKNTPGSYGSYRHNDAWHFGTAAASVAVALLFFASIIPTSVAYVDQIGDSSSITQHKANQAIYQRKAENLTGQLKAYLAVQYPKFEAKIFKQIASNPAALFVLYPQLRSSETLLSLTNTIQNLQNQVYKQETDITAAQKRMTVRKRNPFFLTFVLPRH